MKHIGMARLGRDAEVRYTATGEAVANLSLAVSVYDKEAENNRGTQWIEAALWGKQAESLSQYMLKGSLHCFTLSDMKLDKYTNRDGVDVPKLTARVDSVELGPRVANDNGGSQQRAPAPAPRAAAPAAGRSSAPSSRPADDMDDSDIPF